MPTNAALFVGSVVALSLFLHVVLRFLAPQSSQILLPLATLLNGTGFVEIARWNPPLAQRQAMWTAFSVVAVVATLLVVRRIRDLDRFRYLILTAAIFLLLSPLIPHFGVNINGARLWVIIGPFSFQPVELAKILLAFFFASYFAANRLLLSTPTQRLGSRLIVPPRVLMPILIAWAFSLAILGGENDIGFAMLLFALFMAMLWVTTGLKTYVALGFGLFAVGAEFAFRLFPQVRSRVGFWLNPWSAANLHTSTQLIDGWFSLASGGVIGTGMGLGRSGNIPHITSDMIFAALGEELGLLGVILLLCAFAAFVGEGFAIAQRAHSDYVRLVAAGLSATIGFQSFFIMAGVLRLLPFTGITLPFVAYGGSSLVANYVIVALLLRISDENARERRGGEIVSVRFD
jgi:cell division protein FtsW (lipid II flippase)